MELKHYYHEQDEEEEEEEEDSYDNYYSDYQYYNNSTKTEAKPDWFTQLVLLQADLIHNALSFLFSPVVFLMSVVSHSYHRAQETTLAVQAALHAAPSKASHGLAALLRRLGLGLLGAAYVCVVLAVVLALAVVLGVGLVRVWVDGDPVLLRERLGFDYGEACPKAVFWLEKRKAVLLGVPVGHTFSVSVLLSMPESAFNRDIGVFQISAELISTNGHVMAKSSLPCMLRFRSFPVRLARTFILSVPLLLGIADETQKIAIDQILKHKEGYPRTEAVRVTMIPRAGTAFLPQIYGAEIVLKSKLPWTKELVRRWKWTFYVWTSLYTYVVLVFTLLYFCKPLFFPMLLLSSSERGNGGERSEDRERSLPSSDHELSTAKDEYEAVIKGGDSDGEGIMLEEEEVSEFVRKWRARRGKRKAVYLEAESTGGSSASSLTITREETSGGVLEEEVETRNQCVNQSFLVEI